MIRRPILGALAALALFAWAPPAAAAEKLNVVTTTSLYADLVRQIAGDAVEVRYVAPPKFNIHYIQPKPSDVRNVRRADLFVQSGLDHEHWTDPLLQAAGRTELFRGSVRNADMSTGITLLEVPQGQVDRMEGDIHLFGNPHFYVGPQNVPAMTATLLGKLKELDPDNAAAYDTNAAAFLEKFTARLAEWKTSAEKTAGKEIVSYHKDIAYLADFLGVKAEQFVEPKPGIPPTPKHVGFLAGYMKERGIRLIVTPTYYPRRTAEEVAGRAGGRVAIVCQNAGEVPGTEDVFGFFDHNVKAISEGVA